MPTPHESDKYPKALIVRMVNKVGDVNKIKSLNDVEYKLICVDKSTGREEISTEKYIFEGELSLGIYDKHEINIFPNKKGQVVQKYNGNESWVSVNGEEVKNINDLKTAKNVRKKNFYLFNMMPKLLDSGVNYRFAGMRQVDGVGYNVVEITFDDGIGDTSDKFVLYINSETHLVDQFLFTMTAFDITEPQLMKIEYQEISGVILPVKRRYTKSNWKGEIIDNNWTEEIMIDIKFNNGFNESSFQ